MKQIPLRNHPLRPDKDKIFSGRPYTHGRLGDEGAAIIFPMNGSETPIDGTDGADGASRGV